ncbi:hypothetical protein [Streptococcus acidominimus]|uniref:Uncharacterized protein n=1 Tax=Streptococcus acidominimus TaxID=1326 RepID=A0A1Q8EEP0_STRAI|nr:hypothetical protein [Streptococcus acidominimus]OLF50254.1 hypothetical protein BU200_03120 [Streptococcus acidominimus]SUN06756.1 Uncharacterised protein [Streptococcus acidominimus]
MFFRKIVYMGECGEGAVYFDTERNLALLAPPSRLLNTAGAGKTNLLIPALVALGFGGTGLVVANPFGGYYSYATLIYLVLLWLIECFGLIWLLERALYKNVKQAQSTTRQHFRTAVYGNLFWNNFGDKRATVGKKLFFVFVIISMIIVNIALIPVFLESILPDINNNAQIDNGIILTSLLGLMPAILVILVWQNNPIRWFNIVGRYQRREIPWGKSVN